MLILIHVLIALTSLVWSGVTFFAPSKSRVRSSVGLMAATIASGTWLVIASHSPLLSSCMTGLTYLAFVSAATFAGQRKLSRD